MGCNTSHDQWRSEEWSATTRSALMQIEIGDMVSMPEGPEESLLEYLARNGPTVSNISSLSLVYEFRQLYGAGVARAYRHLLRFQSALADFQERYGAGPVTILRAPARINIIGEHVDYVQYFPTEVLAFGSRQHDMLMLFRPRSDTKICAASSLQSVEPAEFDLAELQQIGHESGDPENIWLEYLHELGVPPRHWTNYVKGAVGYACARYPGMIRRGFDFFVDSTIPAAGGRRRRQRCARSPARPRVWPTTCRSRSKTLPRILRVPNGTSARAEERWTTPSSV